MKSKISLVLALAAFALAGCGTTSNLAGLSVSANVAQKGVVGGVTFTAGTNSITVGGSYSSGTNTVGGTVTVPE
jgi:uncharacterized lipoprotein YajG